MSVDTSFGPVSAHVRDELARLLNERRVVVWYDPTAAFRELVARLDLPGCVVVSAVGSTLRARRDAETAYDAIGANDGSPGARLNLLLYVPRGRAGSSEQRQTDPFEAFTCCGGVFGDNEAEHFLALAQQALPDQTNEIARLFREGQPTLTLLDNLSASARYPLVQQALGSEAPVEALAVGLVRPDAEERLAAVPGAFGELARLAERELGLPAGPAEGYPAWRQRLASYLLVSELAFNLPTELPPALAAVPHAGTPHRGRVLAVADRLRETDVGRDAYQALAVATEQALGLPSLLRGSALGERDTFPCQEQARLATVVEAAARGDLAAARIAFAGGADSVWRREPERAPIWAVADRCLSFLEVVGALEGQSLPSDTRVLVESYTAPDGWWRLDRAQRLYEQADALCGHDDAVEPLLQACRARYRAAVAPLQAAVQAAVRAGGWPPDGVRRQTQTFDAHVAPELAARRKTAYFLVDSLRYEMGRDLAHALADLGAHSVEGTATVLPTTTACGMAALLPGADGAFSLVEQRGELVPALGGAPVPGVPERKAWLQSRYGDRYYDLTLEDVLRYSPRQLARQLGAADLVVVRTQDIDATGEGPSLLRARREMSAVLGDLRKAALRLADLGYQTLVFAADHGHVLVPEVPAGDVIAKPPGVWRLEKRRSLLGQAQAGAAGVVLLRAQDVGIVGPVEDFAAAADFKTFQAGEGYFHEGLSLQECVVPVVVVRAQAPAVPSAASEQVHIAYRFDRFTSSVVQLRVTLSTVVSETRAVRLEAYAGTDPHPPIVGRTADCDARDPATGEITLPANLEVPVPLVIDPEFTGDSIEVRAIDPRSGVILDRLTLKNARLD